MNDKFSRFTESLRRKVGVPINMVKEVQLQLGISLPAEYLEFMIESNGADGFVGSNSYLILWPLEELASLNEASGVHEFAPGLLLFGSDGGGTGYAFDSRSDNMPIVDVPFIPLSLEEAKVCAYSFIEFLEYLYEKQ